LSGTVGSHSSSFLARLMSGLRRAGSSAGSGRCRTGLWLSTRAMTCFAGVRETGFGTEAEVTGKLLRRGIRLYEVPIAYKARSREAGKKLTWRDGAEAVWILLRERFIVRPARH
jgi:hypothetical protein